MSSTPSNNEESADSSTTQAQNLEPASIRTRVLAMVYDGLIILFITTVLVVIIELALVGDKTIDPNSLLNKALKVFWFIPGFFYLAYYWTKNGQTPSMSVWKIKLVNQQGETINWSQALVRYVSAIMGLGIFWVIFNKQRKSLQDVISKTSLLKVSTNISTDSNAK